MRRVRTISSITDQTWFNRTDDTATILFLIPSVAPTLHTINLNQLICQDTHCNIRRISTICVNLRSLTFTSACHPCCATDGVTPADIQCTNLRSLTAYTPPPAWLQLVTTLTPLEVLDIHGWARELASIPLVFKHPHAMQELVAPYDLAPDQLTTLFTGMHNLTVLTISAKHWHHLTHILRTQCPTLQELTVDEVYKHTDNFDYSVFQSGFANLHTLRVREEHDTVEHTIRMFAPLQNLPALTRYITDVGHCKNIAAQALPHVNCLTRFDEHQVALV
jgi:hypothetical protein